MPAPLPLLGSLAAGALAATAAVVTLAAPAANVVPVRAGTSQTTPEVVSVPAPCPAGTVERGDACVRVVRVIVPAPAAAQPPAAPAQTGGAQTAYVPASPYSAPREAAPAPTSSQKRSDDGGSDDGGSEGGDG